VCPPLARAVDRDKCLSDARLSPRLVEQGVHERSGNPGRGLLDGPAPFRGEGRERSPGAEELALEKRLGVTVDRSGPWGHLATTAGRVGVASTARGFFFGGAASVKPQNMIAIPTSSPR
jgi:hypothetical protein